MSACPTEHEHDWSDWNISRPATCTRDGEEKRICEKCGEEETRSINKKGHHIVTDEYVAPGCEADGLTAGSHCDVCDEIIEAQQVIPATGHHYTHADGSCEGCDETINKGTIIPDSNITLCGTGELVIILGSLVPGYVYRLTSSAVDITDSLICTTLKYVHETHTEQTTLTKVVGVTSFSFDFTADSTTEYLRYNQGEVTTNVIALTKHTYDAFGNPELEGGVAIQRTQATYNAETEIPHIGLVIFEVTPLTNKIRINFPTDENKIDQTFKLYDKNGELIGYKGNGQATDVTNDISNPSKFYIHLDVYDVSTTLKVNVRCRHEIGHDGNCPYCHNETYHQYIWNTGSSPFSYEDNEAYIVMPETLFEDTNTVVKLTYSVSNTSLLSSMDVEVYDENGIRKVPNNEQLISIDPTKALYIHITLEESSTVTISYEQSSHYYYNHDGLCVLCGHYGPLFNIYRVENNTFIGHLVHGSLTIGNTLSYLGKDVDEEVEIAIESVAYYVDGEYTHVNTYDRDQNYNDDELYVTLIGLPSNKGVAGAFLYDDEAYDLVSEYDGVVVQSIERTTHVHSGDKFNVTNRRSNWFSMHIEGTIIFEDTNVELNAGERTNAKLVLDVPYVKMSLYEFVLDSNGEPELYFANEYSGLESVQLPKVELDEVIRPAVFHATNDQMYTTPRCEELWVSDLYQYIVQVTYESGSDGLKYKITDRMLGLTEDQINLECILVMYDGNTYSRETSHIAGGEIDGDDQFVLIDSALGITPENVRMILVNWTYVPIEVE